MPSAKEIQFIDEFGDYLDKEIKGADEGKPNALFQNSSPRPFDYRIYKDVNWGFTDWYLKEWTEKNSNK